MNFPEDITANAHLVVDYNDILDSRSIDGVSISTKSIPDGVNVRVRVRDSTIINERIHLCFGMSGEEGSQTINSEFVIGKNSKARFITHCLFPNGKTMKHIMNSTIRIMEGGEMDYKEEHYNSGGIIVTEPNLNAHLSRKSRLSEEFKLVNGNAGKIRINYVIEQEENSTSEISVKILGKGKDDIFVRDEINLNGKGASGITTTRLVLEENAKGNVEGIIRGNAPFTRGHIDCREVVNGNAAASSSPVIRVNDPLSTITHEASIGRINKREIETLMAKGLTENQAVRMIINGLLK